MNKKFKFIIILTTVVFILTFVLISCKDPYQSDEAKGYIKEFKRIVSEFNDKYKLANSTSRIALSPVISDMQDIKNDLNRLEIPEGCEDFTHRQEYCVEAMDYAIEAFLKFQSNSEDLDVIDLLDKADHMLNYTDKWITDTEQSFE